MKLDAMFVNRDYDGKGKLMLKVVAETPKETKELVDLARQVYKPTQTYGQLTETGAWAWLAVPCRGKPPDVYFGNEQATL